MRRLVGLAIVFLCVTAVARASDGIEQFKAGLKASDFALRVLKHSVAPPPPECEVRIRQAVFDILSDPKKAQRINEALRNQSCLSGRFSGIWALQTDYEMLGVPEPSVSLREIKSGFFYLRVRSFERHTLSEFAVAVQFLVMRRPKAILFDLRFNGGGLLEAAVAIAGAFAPAANMPIITVTDIDGTAQVIRSLHKGPLSGIRTVVLVNGASASGAEIVAGALKNWGIPLVGKRTFGKGEWNYAQTDQLSGLVVRSFGGPYCVGEAPHCITVEKKGIEPVFEVSDSNGNESVELTLTIAAAIAADSRFTEKLLTKDGKLKDRVVPASAK